MNRVFVKTRNVKNFIWLVENLTNKPSNIPKMGLVYGEPGLGKSQTALWLAAKYDGIYLRCTNLMTSRWLLQELVKELDEIPRYLTSDNFDLCVQKLSQNSQIIVIDEIDYLMNDTKTIETLRDIHDKINCPIIFVGMGLAHKKLERYKHLYDRFSEIVKYETFNVSDVKQIVEELSEISFIADAVEILHKKHNRFRQIVQAINQFELIAKENNLTEITKETAELIFR
jgi:DNA transposition AAA+ family ATPase